MAKLTRLVLLLLVLLSGCDNYDPDRTAAYLADLGITGYQLEPSFSSSTFNYVATIPPGTDSITVEVSSTHQGATVTVNGILVESDGGSITLQLAEGTNTIKVVVLSSDNMRTQTYTVLVTGQWLSYSVGGAVSGLTGALTLQNNAGDDLAIAADGAFEFATPVTDGDDYAVTVSAQPDGQLCSVTNAAGTIAGANVSDVAVTCVDLVAGLFVDDLVVGLDYRCSSGATSETSADGEFICPLGDDIAFWLGNNRLGPVSTSSIITPHNLFPEDSLAALNLARLLQSLDSDQLPDNGEIVINEALVALLPDAVDFSLSEDEFEQAMSALGIPLVSLEVAQQRLNQGIAQYIPGNAVPTALAGQDQSSGPGLTVTLNGSGSSDADGDTLTYRWGFVSRPNGSHAQLLSPLAVVSSFVPDIAGSYVIGLIVFDGTVTGYDTVIVTSDSGTGAPAAPLGLRAVAGDALVALTWGAVSRATSYKMYYNTTGNVSTSDAWTSGLTSTVINFGSLTNGTTYYYKVAAVNASGEGPLSNQASARPQAPAASLPAMPQGVQAIAGDTLVTINWTAVSGATSYTVYWNTTGGVLASDASIVAGSSTGLSHTGLVNGTNYYYRVAASNASGEGPLSATRLATPAGAPPVVTYSVGGAVTGFPAGTLTLQNNGADDLVITPAGAYFTFPTTLPDGSPYNVTVSAQPEGLTCTVTYLGSGTISGANVTNVGVTCVDNAPVTYSVGGTVSGLSGTVTLQNNGADALDVSVNGSFAFATVVNDGSSYAVTVSTQPAGQTCSVANASGIVSSANITNLAVSCQDNTVTTYSVGGNVNGLIGTLVLQNNVADNKTINTNGGFTFDTPIANAQTYSVTVLTQPQGQVCTVANSSGTVSSSSVTNVLVSCADTGTSKTWMHPVDNQDGFVSIVDRNPVNVKIRVANSGDKVIAWIENFPSADPIGYTRVFMQEYRNGQWSAHPAGTDDAISPPATQEQISWSGIGANEVALEMDNNGNAIIAWEQAGDTRTCAVGAAFCHVMFMKEYRNGSWSANPLYTEFVSPDNETVQDIQISMSDGGDAMITWQGTTINGEPSYLYAREYRNGQWLAPHIVSTIAGQDTGISEHAAAMDSSGNAIVVWRSGSPIYMSEYRNSVWSGPQDSNDDLTGSGGHPHVVMANNGDAVIQWMDGYSSSYMEIFERRNNQWAATTNTDMSLNGTATYAQLAMNASGDTVIAWTERDTSNPFIDPTYGTGIELEHTFVAHYRNGSWTVPQDESDHVTAQPSYSAGSRTLSAGVDDEGNAMVFMVAPDADSNTLTCAFMTCRRLYQTEFFAASNSWTHDTDQIDYAVDAVSPAATMFSHSDSSFDLSANGNGVLLWSGTTLLSTPPPYVYGVYWYLSERK